MCSFQPAVGIGRGGSQGRRSHRDFCFHEKVMGIAAATRRDFRCGLFGQRLHPPLDLFQNVQVNFPARKLADQTLIAKGMNVGHDTVDQPGQGIHVLLVQAALGDPGSAHADAGAQSGDLVPGNGVPVDHDAAQVQDAGGGFAVQREAGGGIHSFQVQKHQVRIRSPVGQAHPSFDQSVCQGAGVGHDLPLQIVETTHFGDLEGDGHRCKLVGVRPTLQTGEYGCVYTVGDVLVGGDDHRSTRATDGLVRGESGHVGDAHRVRIHAGDGHSRRVGYVSHQIGSHRVGNLAEGLPVGSPGVRRVPADDDFRAVLFGQSHYLVVIQPLGGFAHPVGNHFVALAGDVEFATVGQVSALEEVQSHQGIPRLQEGVVHGHVGRGTGKGLHVDVDILGAHPFVGEAGRTAPLSQSLYEVHVVYALVETAVGVATVVSELMAQVQQEFFVVAGHAQWRVPFGVDIVENRAEGLADGGRSVTFRGDKDQAAGLALLFEFDNRVNVGVNRAQIGAETNVSISFGLHYQHSFV